MDIHHPQDRAMKKIFQLLFFHAYVCLCACFISHGCLPHEKDALLLFKQSITPSNQFPPPAAQPLPSWTGNTDCCHDWPEVTCTSSSRVQALHLHSLGLNISDGSFVRPLSTLQELSYLDMSDNTLNISAVLHALSEFPSFTHLNLRNISNQMVTDVELDSLQLRCGTPENNKFSGTLQIGSLPFLAYLDLSNNNIQGNLPGNLDDSMPGIQILILKNNKFSGHLPETIGNCILLQQLEVGNNYFEGEFPNYLLGMQYLMILQMSSNRFHGSIPKDINTMSSLRILDLSNNTFSGNIPANISKLPSFHKPVEDVYLQFSREIFNKGQFMSYEVLPPNMESIDLSGNLLGGEIPRDIGELTALKQLNLSRNHLVGSIPDSITMLREPESLDMSSNQLTGVIPQNFVRMNALEVLDMSYNNLSGSIPRAGQMLTFPDSFLGNPHLKDTLLPTSRSQQQPGETQESVLEESDSSEFWWKVTVGLSFGIGFGGFYLVSSVSHKFRKNGVSKKVR